MKNLYQTKDGLIHECEGEEKVVDNADTFVAWTKCGVPVSQSFRSDELVTCPKCNTGPNKPFHLTLRLGR